MQHAAWKGRSVPNRSAAPGLVAAAAIAAVALLCGTAVPLLGAPIFAILIGVLVRAVIGRHDPLERGLSLAARGVLQAAIVVSGLTLSLPAVMHTGIATLPVMLSTIAAALLLAALAGRWLRLGDEVRTLIGVGTAICGASAIAAVAAVVEPAEASIALAVTVIFFYNVLAVLTFPVLGHALHLSSQAFGIWAGTAINDTSSVVAAGYAYGLHAGQEATVVKLTRASLILPLVGAIALARLRRRGGARVPWHTIVPWFVLWFLVAALLNSAGIVPGPWHPVVAKVSIALISVALAAIGLRTDLPTLIRSGVRPLFFGFALWVTVAFISLIVQHAIGT